MHRHRPSALCLITLLPALAGSFLLLAACASKTNSSGINSSGSNSSGSNSSGQSGSHTASAAGGSATMNGGFEPAMSLQKLREPIDPPNPAAARVIPTPIPTPIPIPTPLQCLSTLPTSCITMRVQRFDRTQGFADYDLYAGFHANNTSGLDLILESADTDATTSAGYATSIVNSGWAVHKRFRAFPPPRTLRITTGRPRNLDVARKELVKLRRDYAKDQSQFPAHLDEAVTLVCITDTKDLAKFHYAFVAETGSANYLPFQGIDAQGAFTTSVDIEKGYFSRYDLTTDKWDAPKPFMPIDKYDTLGDANLRKMIEQAETSSGTKFSK